MVGIESKLNVRSVGGTKPEQSDNTPVSDPGARLLTWGLALIAIGALFKVRSDSWLHDGKWILFLETALYFVFYGWLSFHCSRETESESRQNRRNFSWNQALGVGLLVTPIPVHLIFRLIGKGEAFEILLMVLCQNAALFSIACDKNRQSEKRSVLLSFFLVFFVSTLSESIGIFWFTIPYLILGIWWLIVSHWSGLRAHMPHQVKRNFRLTTVSFMAVIGVVLSLVVVIGWNHERVMSTVNGWMPTSGGSRFSDQFARGGVGDGDFFVAARQQTSTVGPVESDLFLESTRPSLFDVMEENYSSPLIPKKKKSERAFSPDDAELKHLQEKIIQSEQSGRTFRTLRGTDEKKRKVTERKSEALFYLGGPVPIRLAQSYYDHFDGLDWTVSPELDARPRSPLEGIEVDHQYWVRVRSRSKPESRDKQGTAEPTHPYFQGMEKHTIKIMRLAANRILAPSSMKGWHFDECDNTSYFGWTGDGAIEFRGRDALPEFAIYHVISQGVNYAKLSGSTERRLTGFKSCFRQLPTIDEMEWCRRKARSLRDESKTDWQNVQSIIKWCRENFEVASDDTRTSNSPVDFKSPLQALLDSKQGTDYLVATAAAMMLRSIGMEVRLVKGFYVGPEDFDTYSAQSIVYSGNLHFWLEVRVDGKDWITVEPSAGYHPPRTKVTWSQRILSGLWRLIGWFARHPLLVFGISLLIAGMVWFRKRLIANLLVFAWWVEGVGSTRRKLLATLRLMRRREKLLTSNGSEKSVSQLFQAYRADGGTGKTEVSYQQLNLAINQILYRSEASLDHLDRLSPDIWGIVNAPMTSWTSEA